MGPEPVDQSASVARSVNPAIRILDPNTGWTSLGGQAAFDKVELLESGPLRGRLRLTRAGESWELIWTAAGLAPVAL